MKLVIRNLGDRAFIGFKSSDRTKEWLELRNQCDKTFFEKDLDNFLTSKYAKDFELIIDKRVIDYGFHSPLLFWEERYSMDKCLELLKNDGSKYIVLTIGKSTWFPPFGGTPSRYSGHSPYPALKGLRNIHIAEIHGCAARYSDSDSAAFLKIDKYYRISVGEIDGVESTVKRVARFENGKEIDESNLKPGEDLDEVLHFSNFDGPGEYRDAVAAEGKGFGITCCWGVSQTMKKYHLSFADAMRRTIKSGALIMIQPEKVYPALGNYKQVEGQSNKS
jgi:hypothetical protein